MSAQPKDIRVDDRHPDVEDTLETVRRGLAATPKRLPSRLFYDERGSALFEAICEQPEYYLTRTEIAIMRDHAADIAATLGPDVRLVEYGSGSGIKTRMLLEHLETPVAYVPVEISRSALMESVAELATRFPDVPMQPVCADFTQPLRLPVASRSPRRTVIYFPGSTIGNFETKDAIRILRQMRAEMSDGGGVVVGVDLKKDTAQIEAAYNDAAGVTRDFTLNMLVRLNREIGADFDVASFRHRARYNALAGRIETDLVSTKRQDVRVGGETFAFREDEAMHVEYSCKYSLDDFAQMASKAGLAVEKVWMDEDRRFSVQYLVRSSPVA
ncbi:MULTISPECIES: L-histidine N(alpha)-methyltransferase [unclassified Luteibacter]|uniref:L-histidine N(alpha)-methyltransferase n=1 Tax=unclassified Luteibacter TaxID=2620188 RepID=UPI0008D299D7|nr:MULTISPECIES: L-histidine N(alpha)-methyltransferase [unclassified Luteibacter]MDR6936273.1 dimethylhistidine N-methyltransferase [Luteibacter sp. 3190]SEO58854.1 dimethylhistidine N-methyltransferase [Luteibacter sp. UNC138MFCol5.1]SEV87007.1 dimethylhistidine N-methyltransferase [Luteibacter sp. 329MFSha]